MKKAFISLFSGLLLLGFSNGVNAAVVNFDDLPVQDISYINNPILNGYEGFDWQNIGYQSVNVPYVIEGISYPNIAITHNWEPEISITRDELFTFNGMNLIAGRYEEVPFIVQIKAYDNNTIKYDKTIVLNLPPLEEGIHHNDLFWINFDFENINKLTFNSYFDFPEGSQYYEYRTSPLIIDNFTYNEPISPHPAPEPSSIIFGLLGLSGVYGMNKRIKN